MRAHSPHLRQLANLYGIEPAYTDIFNNRKVASAESILETLRALRAPIEKPGDVADALHSRQLEIWKTCLEPVSVSWNGRAANVSLRLPAKRATGIAQLSVLTEDGDRIRWTEKLQNLRTRKRVQLDGETYVQKRIATPRVPIGYHRLHVEFTKTKIEALLIAAPVRSYEVTEKSWGAFLPLYALHSQSSWGVGDFSDLRALQEWLAEFGGKVVATLPFSAAFLREPFEPSPYMPASRLFWNELYIDPRLAEEFRVSRAAQRLAGSSTMADRVAAQRKAPLVDYRTQMALKRRVLAEMARALAESDSPRRAAFEKYVSSHPRLQDYAAFRATGEHRKTAWPDWPARLRDGTLRQSDYELSDFRYHQYVQWIAEEQLAELSWSGSGSSNTLYLDLPLGVHPDSYDVWRDRERFALGASTGAPPDTLFTKGQNWGFPPPHPDVVRRNGYAYWIECLRRQFEFANILRIDHVMGLHRLFWVPRSLEAKDGVYVRYHPQELYAILSIESHRSKTMIVGENLGTVPDAVNRAMARHRVQQMYVLQYEVQPGNSTPLRTPPANSVASLNTHDMPPFSAFTAAADVDELERMGLFSADEAKDQRLFRERSWQALAGFFRVKSPRGGGPDPLKLAQACLEWLARSPAKLVLVNLEDLWGETAPQNIPGTGPERPNWRRKARYSLEEFTNLPAIRKSLARVNDLRSNGLS